jgi:large subunit ribosomal protein L21
MFAVIVDGGRQYRVEPGNELRLDYREAANPGDAIRFETVLLAGTTSANQIGRPQISGALVEGEVVKQQLGKKIEIGKFKRRKKYRRHTGHRQKYTTIKITSISIPGLVDEPAAEAPAAAE